MSAQFLLLAIPLALLLIGAPIGIALAATSAIYMLIVDVPLVAVAQRIYTSLDQFTLTAIPAFMLAGAIMEHAGISRRLVDFAMAGVGRYRAGMPKVTILTSMLFGGMSGAAAADSAAVGAVMVPEMERHNYPRPYSAALVAAASITAVLIPPSIPLVFYGVLASTSISQLLLAGAIPGLLAGSALMAVVHFQKEARAEVKPKGNGQSFLRTVWRALPVLALPGIILGGIFFGLVTATEAAVVAVAYALFLGCIALRSLKLADAGRLFGQTAVNSSTVMLLIALASVYSWILTRELIPQQIAEMVLSISQERWAILLLINLMLLIVGCLLDTGSAMIIFVSIFFPVIKDLGIDPVHFGVIMVFNLAIGMLTPPVGICLMVASSVSQVPVQKLVRPVLPFIGALLVVLGLVTYVPEVSLWLPSLSRGN
ncbi:MAG: TRAP transporter large permease [Rubrivivax sp.]|nr:TRAP transporter large permease [Rubrivivax sp.]